MRYSPWGYPIMKLRSAVVSCNYPHTHNQLITYAVQVFTLNKLLDHDGRSSMMHIRYTIQLGITVGSPPPPSNSLQDQETLLIFPYWDMKAKIGTSQLCRKFSQPSEFSAELTCTNFGLHIPVRKCLLGLK